MKWLKEIEAWLLPIKNNCGETSYEAAAVELTIGKFRDVEQELATTKKRLEEALTIIKFYAEGSNNMDYWKHETLGYYRGKRAKEFLKTMDISDKNQAKKSLKDDN